MSQILDVISPETWIQCRELMLPWAHQCTYYLRRMSGDAEDVVNSALASTWRQLRSIDKCALQSLSAASIHQMLVFLAYHNLKRKFERNKKRASSLRTRETLFTQLSLDSDAASLFADELPSPSDTDAVCQLLLAPLSEESAEVQAIGKLCIQGYQAKEISEQLNVKLHRVYRAFYRIEKRLFAEHLD